jgi:hypothetical protein
VPGLTIGESADNLALGLLAEFEARLSDMEQKVGHLPDQSDVIGGDETTPLHLAFLIVKDPRDGAGAFDVKVLGGFKVVIHISRDGEADQFHTCAASQTAYLYVEYTYGTGWGSFTWATSVPAEDPARRLFVIGYVETGADSITLMHNDHVGSLEVYETEIC